MKIGCLLIVNYYSLWTKNSNYGGKFRAIPRFMKHCFVKDSKAAISITRKMVPNTGRAHSLYFGVFKNNRGEGRQNSRPINLPKVITFSTDYNYTT